MFYYTTQFDLYKDIQQTKLLELEAKHIAQVTCAKSKSALERAIVSGHQWCVLGSHRESSIEKEIERVDTMCKSDFNRPIRVVLTKDGRTWSDNNHTTLAYIKRHGCNVKLIDVPHYFIDFRREVPKVISVNNSVLDSVVEIVNAINQAARLQDRLKFGYRAGGFTWAISDLRNQLIQFS